MIDYLGDIEKKILECYIATANVYNNNEMMPLVISIDNKKGVKEITPIMIFQIQTLIEFTTYEELIDKIYSGHQDTKDTKFVVTYSDNKVIKIGGIKTYYYRKVTKTINEKYAYEGPWKKHN